jgi:hypothetical protein
MITKNDDMLALSERLLQLANDEGTAQIHNVAIKIAALASHPAQHPASAVSAEMVMAGAMAMVALGRTHRKADKPMPSRTEEARACLEAALGVGSAQEPIGYAPFHPSHGWRPDLAAKKEQIATAVLMRSIDGAAQLGWSVS